MTDRPILRLSEPTLGDRLPGRPDRRRRPQGVGRQGQEARLGDTFSRLDEAFRGENPDVFLRQDPAGIAPERALVFEVVLPIQNFQKAAAKAGFELLIEDRLDDDYEIPDEMIDDYVDTASPTLYATMPSNAELQKLLSLWKSYLAQERADRGLAPWWKLFEMLSDVRVWGPQDRLTSETRQELAYRLAGDDDAPIRLELEIWPTANTDLRSRWTRETSAKLEALGGRIVTSSSIEETDFVYQAILAEMPSAAIRAMLDNPMAPEGIATLDGLQFILPQTIAQSLPDTSEAQLALDSGPLVDFDVNASINAVLLDGTPIAGHPALNDGVIIEDVHDIVRLSQVEHRRHATAMASLILRGDLRADGVPAPNSRLLAIPILVDNASGATSPNDRLFVDLVHVALTRAFLGNDALAPDAHVVNFSVCIKGAHFAGKIGSLARLLDWWSDRHGILFMVAAGNASDKLLIPEATSIDFEDASPRARRQLVNAAQRLSRHTRTMMAPAEAMNVLTVGAASKDFTEPTSPPTAGTVAINEDGEVFPAVYSGLGLGAFRSIKPDFLMSGGEHELRLLPNGAEGVMLRVASTTQRTGLHVATVQRGAATTYRTRGTSCANALATRATLFSVAALTNPEGPYADLGLSPRDKALLAKALCINAASWPETAVSHFEQECALNPHHHVRAREDVCRHYGHGLLDEVRMREAPPYGVTMVGLGSLRRDKAALFQVPLPPSLSGQRIGRSMIVTIAWFSPVRATRARYRLALLEAIAHGYDLLGELIPDDGWALGMRTGHLDANIIKRGTVWSRRLIHSGSTVPGYVDGTTLPIRVQCRDVSGGGLSPDEDIHFAVVITMEVEAEAEFDVHQEVQQKLRVGLRQLV